MKQSLLTSAFVAVCALGAYAQSSLQILDANNVDVTGTTVQVYMVPGASYTGNFNVKNTTSSNMTAKARKEESSMATGASSSICFGGVCYGPATYMTSCKPDMAMQTALFTADFNYGTTMNLSTVRYVIYDCANTADSVSFNIVYNASPAGIQNYAANCSISEPYPNPASAALNFDYKLGNMPGNASIVVFNLLGSRVKTVDLSEANGTVRLDVADLEAGMYFYTLQLNGKATVSRKFIIKH
jgi:hypothetical protein